MQATLTRSQPINLKATDSPLQVLVVDDQDINRWQLIHLLEANGYRCIEAASGIEAIEIVKKEPQLAMILMDVVMPGMDGLEATRNIKKIVGQAHIPIIFVTASQEKDLLESCFSVGGDDFIARPINPSVLLSRLKAHSRVYCLHNSLEQSNKVLSRYNRNIAAELQVVEHVFTNVIKPRMLECPSLSVSLSPMSMFNGDLYLAYRTETGNTYLFIGDFTGHGLSAAIGCMPVADVFYAMAAKYSAVGDIAAEVNRKLTKILPSNMFCCAAIFELSPTMNRVKIWSGGMHDIFVVDSANGAVDTVHSQHMPLGILNEQEFDRGIQDKTLSGSVQILAYSDGLIEAQNPSGDLYGEERLEKTVRAAKGGLIDCVLRDLDSFKEGREQKDDITLLEINTALAPVSVAQKQPEKLSENSYLPSVINPNISIQLGSEPRQLQLRFVPAKIMAAQGLEGIDQQILSFEEGQNLPIVHVYRLIKALLHSIKLTEQNTSQESELPLAAYDHEICMHLERLADDQDPGVSAEVFLLGTELDDVNEFNSGYRWRFNTLNTSIGYTSPRWRKYEVYSSGRILRVEVSNW